jgi:uncharacterized protein YjfI (DUF2170 family)
LVIEMAKGKGTEVSVPKTAKKGSAYYMEQMRARFRELGYVKRDVWILPENASALREIEKRLRQPLTADASNLETLMSVNQAWNTKSLFEALSGHAISANGTISVAIAGSIEQSLHVTVNSHGELPMFVAVQGEQILVESTLFPVSSIENQEEFNQLVLRSRAMFPLSAMSIEQDGNGVQQYVMYGALSAGSTLESVVTEIETLADNIMNAALAFQSFYKN